MTRIIPLLILIIPIFFFPSTAKSAGEGPIPEDEALVAWLPIVTRECWPKLTPAGALLEQPAPVFCSINNSASNTSTSGNNSWLDDFDHGATFSDFSRTGYYIYNSMANINQSIHWRHANHWMVDLATRRINEAPEQSSGAAFLRPDQTFQFENGKLIVEADVAAGMSAYEVNVWPEIVISMADRPLGFTPGSSLYAYDMFPEDWTLGCRLQATRHPICALKDNSGNFEAHKGPGMVWEMSWFQHVGTNTYGGNALDGRGDYWRECDYDEPDIKCRDRFRLELTRTSLTLYVNGIKYFQQTGIPPLPDALFNGNVYVYFASTVWKHPADTIRYHWDRIAVNPEGPPTAAPGFEPPAP